MANIMTRPSVLICELITYEAKAHKSALDWLSQNPICQPPPKLAASSIPTCPSPTWSPTLNLFFIINHTTDWWLNVDEHLHERVLSFFVFRKRLFGTYLFPECIPVLRFHLSKTTLLHPYLLPSNLYRPSQRTFVQVDVPGEAAAPNC